MAGPSPRGTSTRGMALLERRHTLAPEPASAAVARRVLREVLAELERATWADMGELAISEVVTNASLHAHTPIELRVEGFSDEVCVQVRDYNPTVPLPRDYDDEATTGRGMGLVAMISRACGVQSLGEEGKIVWFCVGEPPDVAADDPLAAWDIDDWADDGATTTPATCEVVLESMPATLWLSARQHHDAILRELVLYLAEHDGTDADLVTADRARSLISGGLVAALEASHAAGTARPALSHGPLTRLPWVPEHLDLGLQIAADAGPDFAVLQDVLDLAESLAVDGHLFVQPGLPEIIAVRDWVCDQVIAQVAGAPPAPWPGTDQESFEVTVHDRAAVQRDWDATIVTEATAGVIAADDANRIVAVSRALADRLGWDVDDLVGRRVIAVVPPRLRESHVAGFSRYLSTGESHIVGVPLELPVLRHDGSELVCRFVLERAPGTTGRPIYLAWIEPLDDA